MFQTARPKNHKVPRPVRIELRDGRVLRGTLMLSRSETTTSLLGKASPFLTVKTADGELGINRDAIAAILLGDAETSSEAPKPQRARAHPLDGEDDKVADPCRVLRVRPGATEAELKSAWKARMQQVHPDKLQSSGAAPSIIAAAQREAALVNEAYEKLREARQEPLGSL